MEELQIIQNKIYEIRGQKVMLDRDLAELYHVETRALKQAVKRNTDRFPADFMFVLSKEEANMLLSIGVSQNVIPPEYNIGVTEMFAFTEQGVSMLSSVLRSKTAIAINVSIMRAFVTLRSQVAGNSGVAAEVESRYNERFEALKRKFGQLFCALIGLYIKRRIFPALYLLFAL